MVQVIEANNDWADAFRQIGGGATKGYMHGADEKALQKAVSELPSNATARQILDTITSTKTYSPEAKQNMLKNYLGGAEFEELQKQHREQEKYNAAQQDIEKSRTAAQVTAETNRETERAHKRSEAEKKTANERKSADVLIDNNPLIPEEKKAALRGNVSLKTAEDLMKDALNPPKQKGEKQSTFQKKLDSKLADDYIVTLKEIPKFKDTLESIAHVQKLSDELTAKEYALGHLGLSGPAEEMRGNSFALMEPIVKMFNPSGPISTQKLKTIQDKFTINKWDVKSVRDAKLKTLKRFADQGMKRAQDRKELIEQMQGMSPEKMQEAIEKFDAESETMTDAFANYDLLAQEATVPGLPDPKQWKDKNKNKALVSPTGERYISDGTRWVKK